MPLYVSWANPENTILICESEGKWTWDEYHAALDQVKAMVESVNHRVDLINLDRPGAVMPSGSPMPHFQRAEKMMPDNLKVNVVVIRNSIGRIMASVLSKMPGNNMDRVLLASSMDEAYALIRQDREECHQT